MSTRTSMSSSRFKSISSQTTSEGRPTSFLWSISSCLIVSWVLSVKTICSISQSYSWASHCLTACYQWRLTESCRTRDCYQELPRCWWLPKTSHRSHILPMISSRCEDTKPTSWIRLDKFSSTKRLLMQSTVRKMARSACSRSCQKAPLFQLKTYTSWEKSSWSAYSHSTSSSLMQDKKKMPWQVQTSKRCKMTLLQTLNRQSARCSWLHRAYATFSTTWTNSWSSCSIVKLHMRSKRGSHRMGSSQMKVSQKQKEGLKSTTTRTIITSLTCRRVSIRLWKQSSQSWLALSISTATWCRTKVHKRMILA